MSWCRVVNVISVFVLSKTMIVKKNMLILTCRYTVILVRISLLCKKLAYLCCYKTLYCPVNTYFAPGSRLIYVGQNICNMFIASPCSFQCILLLVLLLIVFYFGWYTVTDDSIKDGLSCSEICDWIMCAFFSFFCFFLKSSTFKLCKWLCVTSLWYLDGLLYTDCFPVRAYRGCCSSEGRSSNLGQDSALKGSIIQLRST
jgi:hypothetical protein